MMPNIMQILRNNINNPTVKNAYDLYQKGDGKGLEQLARNVCQSKGLNIEDVIRQIRGNAR